MVIAATSGNTTYERLPLDQDAKNAPWTRAWHWCGGGKEPVSAPLLLKVQAMTRAVQPLATASSSHLSVPLQYPDLSWPQQQVADECRWQDPTSQSVHINYSIKCLLRGK